MVLDPAVGLSIPSIPGSLLGVEMTVEAEKGDATAVPLLRLEPNPTRRRTL